MFKARRVSIISFYTQPRLITLFSLLRNGISAIEAIQIFEKYSFFSGLKPNKSKCEKVGIDALKGVQMAICGIKCVYLNTNKIKIFFI